MPIYEYRCNGCNRVVSIFFRSYSAVTFATCPECGSNDLSRVVSRVAIVKTEAERLSDLSEAALAGGINPGDHSSIDRYARKVAEELGDEIAAPMQGMLDRLEAGDPPPELADPQYYAQHLINKKRLGIDDSGDGGDSGGGTPE